MRRGVRGIAAVSVLALALAGGAWLTAQRPSNDREWVPDQDRLPVARFDGELVHISNVRNFEYISADTARARWEDRTYDLAGLNSVWYAVVPFKGSRGMAHTFVSFGFGDSQYVSISVEVRKEAGETYGPLKGLLRAYELMYVVADEQDVLKVRTNFRGDSVFLYRINTIPERARELFVAMLEQSNALGERPAFYNTLTRNCTTTIVRHVNTIAPGRIPFSYKVLLPGYADELAYEIGLLDASQSFEEIRRRAYVTERAQRAGNNAHFSRLIRTEIDGGGLH